jgi:hypothetical protein
MNPQSSATILFQAFGKPQKGGSDKRIISSEISNSMNSNNLRRSTQSACTCALLTRDLFGRSPQGDKGQNQWDYVN